MSKLTKAVVLNSFPHGRFWQFVYKENVRCTSCFGCYIPRPSTYINAKRISITRIYFAFFWESRNDRLNEFVMLIYIYYNAMRSCNERTTLHYVESYLYYIILVNKKIFSEEWNEGEKIYIYEFWRVFLTCFAASGNELYIFRQCAYISIVLFQKPQRNCQIVSKEQKQALF
jgi:hypothetical protein